VVSIKRQLSVALLVGVGSTLVGCKTPMGSGLAFWKNDDTSLASSAPDTGRQKYENLSKEFGGASTPSGGLGSQPTPSDDGPVVSTWNKTTGAIAAAFATKPKVESADPTSLTSKTGKLGPDVYVARGRLYESQDKPIEAIANYEKALSVAPNDVGALVSLARLHDRRGNSAKAVEIYHKALKAHPKSALVHNDLGLCYARQKQFQRATESLNKAIALQPGNPKYRNNMATVMVELGRTDEAYKQLAAVNGEAVAHFNLAYLLDQKGQSGPAVQQLQLAIAKDPTLAPAQEMLAQLTGQQPQSGPAGESRLAAQPVSTPIYRPADVPWQPSAAQQPASQPSIQAPYATSPSDQTPAQVSGSGGSYTISDDIGPIPPGPATGYTDWGAPAPAPTSGGPAAESPTYSGVEPLPPIEG
jgi:cytochrome c-type biogenesis protein CcmH/NrfG